jgi:hypothetical protein
LCAIVRRSRRWHWVECDADAAAAELEAVGPSLTREDALLLVGGAPPLAGLDDAARNLDGGALQDARLLASYYMHVLSVLESKRLLPQAARFAELALPYARLVDVRAAASLRASAFRLHLARGAFEAAYRAMLPHVYSACAAGGRQRCGCARRHGAGAADRGAAWRRECRGERRALAHRRAAPPGRGAVRAARAGDAVRAAVCRHGRPGAPAAAQQGAALAAQGQARLLCDSVRVRGVPRRPSARGNRHVRVRDAARERVERRRRHRRPRAAARRARRHADGAAARRAAVALAAARAHVAAPVAEAHAQLGRGERAAAADESSERTALDVVSLADLERERSLVAARVELVRSGTVQSAGGVGGDIGADDAVVLLCHTGDYARALSLARQCGADAAPIFDGLVQACATNRCAGLRVDDDMLDDSIGLPATPQASAWRALRCCLAQYDGAPTAHAMYTRVAARLLALDTRARLPHWLRSTLLRDNPAALLRVYLAFASSGSVALLNDACEAVQAILQRDANQVAAAESHRFGVGAARVQP